MRKTTLVCMLIVLCMMSTSAFALTAQQSYNVNILKVNSDGSTTSVSSSATATADANGKITFTLTGVPDNTSCNFMLVEATNTATNTVERKSLVPCATAGTTLPLGISGVTDLQTTALVDAFAAAKTDDPILAVFGLAIVRTTGIQPGELAALAAIANSGISGTGGYVDYLKTTRGVTAAQLALYRGNIVTRLADPSAGYSKLIKDSVDATTTTDAAGKRGNAASVLLGILVKATANTGIHPGWIMEAFNAMGSIAKPAIQSSTAISATTKQAINSSIGGGIQKLRVQQAIQKYSDALTLLGGTVADVTQFQNAANTLATTMDTTFSNFEKSSFATGSESAATMQAAQAALQTAMQTAFSTFITSIAASDARITTMISNICNAIGNPTTIFDPSTGTLGACTTALADQNLGTYGRFKFSVPDPTNPGNQISMNWPLNMVILTDWATSIKAAGGTLLYARDSISLSSVANMMPWLGACLKGGTYQNSLFNQAACTGDNPLNTWTPGRKCYGGTFGQSSTDANEVGLCMGNPAPYSNLSAIQEDINIRQFLRQTALQSAGSDLGGNRDVEKAFNDALLTAIAGNISGTTNGTTAISVNQKRAVMELMQPPQM